MSIKVSLNTTSNPPVTVDPEVENVNNGNQTITWVPAQNQPDFTFVGVAFLTQPNPFAGPAFSSNAQQMTVSDDNSTPGTFPYIIMVNSEGIDYCSAAASGIIGNGGTPKIKNN